VFDGARVGGLSERTPVDFMKVATQPKAEGGLGLKHNTAAGDLAILRRALETTLTTPASAFRAPFEIPRAEKVLHGIFSPAEIARIALAAFEGRVWDASAGDWARAPDGSPALCDRKTARAREPLGRIFRLGLMFGSRPCVHLRVTWVDLGGPWIDLDRRILHRLGRAEEETAKRKGRCRIPKADLPTLRAWRDGDLARGIVHVVHRPDGAPLARVDYRVWRRMMAASGARPLGPHSCKHTLVQAMKRARVALSAVAEYVFTREKTLQEHYGADWDEALTAQAARALSDPAFYSRGWPQDGEVVGAGGLAATWADAETDDAAAEALEELDEADSEEDAAAA
jgi:integrase